MSDVRQWLETIGLAQYADAFEANDIDMELLRQIDDQALRDLGMSSAGHRLRIRNEVLPMATDNMEGSSRKLERSTEKMQRSTAATGRAENAPTGAGRRLAGMR